MEVFAGFLAHADHHIGRLLDAIAALPDADNTLILYIAGDNGPSAEGSLTGTLNNMMTQSGIPDTVQGQLPVIDEIGGPKHENHYPVGWSWAGSAPFKWMKRVPSHFGGTRNGLVVSWPAHIKEKGGLRTQFHHVVDIVPTIYEAVGVKAPTKVDGITQTPLAGASMLYSFNSAAAPGTRHTQYFETGGHRAIYHDGWIATAFHGVPWVLTGSSGNFDADKWELYNIDKDFSEAVDLADKEPGRLTQLKALFDKEARKFNVYPLDDRFVERALTPDRPSVVRGRTTFTYAPGTTRIPEGSAPPIYQRSHKITAKIVVPNAETEGVIIATGGSSAGYTLFVKDGKVVYDYNFFGKAHYRVVSDIPLPTGDVEIVLDYTQKPFKQFVESTGGPAKLFINGKVAGEGEIANVTPGRFSATETLDIGMDLGSTVSPDYHDKAPFAFTGTIKEVTVEVK
jgi:arylsulfatase